MFTLLSVIIGPIITGIIGNALVQRWQLRSWYAQQRQLNRKEELDQLQRLFDELSSVANARLFALRSFLRSLSSDENILEERKRNYQRYLATWNEELNTFYARLTLYIGYDRTLRLEEHIHKPFVRASMETEALYEAKKRGNHPALKKVQHVEREINQLQGQISEFIKDILSDLIKKRKNLVDGKRIFFNEDNLDKFSTFQLIKFLFKSDIDGAYVVRSP